VDALERAMSATATAVALASSRLGDAALRQLFLDARSQNRWLPQPVDDAVLRELYELARMAPTAANSQPMRLVFLTSGHAKERLRPALAPGNVEKTMTAPAVAIVAHDLAFYDHLPALMPHVDARAWFASKPADEIERDALHGAAMQGAYLILAARALGLDCGPIGGFDHAQVDAIFFPDDRWKSNFILNLGFGDPTGLFPRNPRLGFEDACRII
jgi:3-hydroxypropanoate dehydrogenase